MTTILCVGETTPARLRTILDAAVTRLGMTDLAVLAETDMDDLVCAWNARRYQLTRWWVEPVGIGVALVFPGHVGALPAAERLIWC